MGHWDWQAIEIREGEAPESVLQALPPNHSFHFNSTFFYRSTYWLHLGWDDANAAAYSALVAFCQKTGRRWITSYARDRRAELDTSFFGWEYPLREERLKEVFGPPQQAGQEKDQADLPGNYARPGLEARALEC